MPNLLKSEILNFGFFSGLAKLNRQPKHLLLYSIGGKKHAHATWGWKNNGNFLVLVNFAFRNVEVEKHCLHLSNFKPLDHRTALLKIYQYGHAGMLHRLTRSHMDQSKGSKPTWRILVWVSLINSYHTYQCAQMYF